MDLGNLLNALIQKTLSELFRQGELFQLTYSAYDEIVKNIQNGDEDVLTLRYPLGYTNDKKPILGNREYKKSELISDYQGLASSELSTNGIYRLMTIIESSLNDVLRLVILKYPSKVGSKRSVKSEIILGSASLDELRLRVIDALVNELSYKSPKEYSAEFKSLVSVNLLECPSFHKYVEVKATRDIHIHNKGIANELYTSKAGSHARAKPGQFLGISEGYFLESYENCIQLFEWLESQLHDIWPSSDFEERQRAKKQNNSIQPTANAATD